MNAATASAAFRILVVDDTPSIHADFRKILALQGAEAPLEAAETAVFGSRQTTEATGAFRFDCALQGQDALVLVEAANAADDPYALAFVDMRMPPGWDGMETIRHLWAVDPALQIVICTAYSDYSWADTIRQLGAADNLIILKKPFDNIEVLQLAHALTRKWQLARENRARLSSLDELVRERTGALERAEECIAKAFSANPLAQAIIALDTMEVLEVNAAFRRTLELGGPEATDPASTESALRLNPMHWQALLERLTAHEAVDDFAFDYEPRPGVRLNLRCSSRQITIDGRSCAICVLRDVTDQLLLEQQLLQSQKMEAVGQLAAGVAHDFNNLLTIIQSYKGFVLSDGSLRADHRAGLAHIGAAADRATALTRQLLAFSRRQITQPTLLDLTVVLRDFRKMLVRLVPERITLEFQWGTDLPMVSADVANLEHVVMNLVVNARDALSGCGNITVSANAVTLDATAARRHRDARPGPFVCLSVADNGTGIEPSLLPRIFDPFFTTKAVGQGTGLGLSTVHGIVHQHGGWIEVTSSLGQGTVFELYFPVATGPIGPAVTPREPGETGTAPRRGNGERILIAEDDRAVRTVARAIITRAGYRVTEAVDGPSAITAWNDGGRRFDLLLTDVVMPNGYSGLELAHRLRQDDPGLKVILATGYSAELLKNDLARQGNFPVLLKPYTSEALLEAVRFALDTQALMGATA